MYYLYQQGLIGSCFDRMYFLTLIAYFHVQIVPYLTTRSPWITVFSTFSVFPHPSFLLEYTHTPPAWGQLLLQRALVYILSGHNYTVCLSTLLCLHSLKITFSYQLLQYHSTPVHCSTLHFCNLKSTVDRRLIEMLTASHLIHWKTALFLEACRSSNLPTSISGGILFLTSLWTIGNLISGHHRDHLADINQKDPLH